MPTRLPVLQGEAEWGFAHFQAVGLGERLICEPRVALSGRKEDMAVGIKLLTCSQNKFLTKFCSPHRKGWCWVENGSP